MAKSRYVLTEIEEPDNGLSRFSVTGMTFNALEETVKLIPGLAGQGIYSGTDRHTHACVHMHVHIDTHRDQESQVRPVEMDPEVEAALGLRCLEGPGKEVNHGQFLEEEKLG